jgi:hypothetical protein
MELTTSISRYLVAALTATIIIFVSARQFGGRRLPWATVARVRSREPRSQAKGPTDGTGA